MRICTGCHTPLLERHKIKFCSNKCQNDHKYRQYIEKWKKDSKNGGRWIKTKNISCHLRRYLLDKYNNKCAKCGWHKRHPITGNVPLEVDHIDGDSDNNSEKNLTLLCPNCHALTPYFKNLNKGKGRKWRKTLKDYLV